jgi:ATP-dependent DNA helicase RecG
LDRVKVCVKEKSNQKLLAHYYLAIGGHLTHLGILCISRREDRARLGTAPIIQFIKYDADGRKVNTIAWDDHSHSPMSLSFAALFSLSCFKGQRMKRNGIGSMNI